jgi:hypothetical protein
MKRERCGLKLERESGLKIRDSNITRWLELIFAKLYSKG